MSGSCIYHSEVLKWIHINKSIRTAEIQSRLDRFNSVISEHWSEASIQSEFIKTVVLIAVYVTVYSICYKRKAGHNKSWPIRSEPSTAQWYIIFKNDRHKLVVRRVRYVVFQKFGNAPDDRKLEKDILPTRSPVRSHLDPRKSRL